MVAKRERRRKASGYTSAIAAYTPSSWWEEKSFASLRIINARRAISINLVTDRRQKSARRSRNQRVATVYEPHTTFLYIALCSRSCSESFVYPNEIRQRPSSIPYYTGALLAADTRGERGAAAAANLLKNKDRQRSLRRSRAYAYRSRTSKIITDTGVCYARLRYGSSECIECSALQKRQRSTIRMLCLSANRDIFTRPVLFCLLLPGRCPTVNIQRVSFDIGRIATRDRPEMLATYGLYSLSKIYICARERVCEPIFWKFLLTKDIRGNRLGFILSHHSIRISTLTLAIVKKRPSMPRARPIGNRHISSRHILVKVGQRSTSISIFSLSVALLSFQGDGWLNGQTDEQGTQTSRCVKKKYNPLNPNRDVGIWHRVDFDIKKSSRARSPRRSSASIGDLREEHKEARCPAAFGSPHTHAACIRASGEVASKSCEAVVNLTTNRKQSVRDEPRISNRQDTRKRLFSFGRSLC
ncbi:unnamed protein product [Trichogramma brassicae]|uniref:Uncharacterized protein n=1 Tax=Trichogramma brassicae TaxID=86971 RepID=A0A6H5IB10_9HYME|nr:unnamed protein product [Trichogramma brassicae]